MNKSMDALNDDIVSFENRGQQNTAKSVYNDANFEQKFEKTRNRYKNATSEASIKQVDFKSEDKSKDNSKSYQTADTKDEPFYYPNLKKKLET